MTATIPLTRGLYAVVDDADFAALSAFKWHTQRAGPLSYAKRCTGDSAVGNRRDHFMHRVLMDAPCGLVVDHINGDGLDNRRVNLRVCTHSQNIVNRHAQARNAFYGVYFHKRAQKWAAQLRVHGKHHYLGLFETDLEAAKARDEAARRLQGEFAVLNFPDPQIIDARAAMANGGAR